MSDSKSLWLGPRLRAVLYAVGARVIPEGGAVPYDLRDTDLDRYIREVGETSPDARLGLRASLIFLQFLAPLLVMFRFARFTSLSAEVQDQLMQRLHHHRIYVFRAMLLIANTVLQMALYAEPKVMQYVGFHNEVAGRNKRDGFLPPELQAKLKPSETGHAH